MTRNLTIKQIITLAIAEAIVQRRPFTCLALSDGAPCRATCHA